MGQTKRRGPRYRRLKLRAGDTVVATAAQSPSRPIAHSPIRLSFLVEQGADRWEFKPLDLLGLRCGLFQGRAQFGEIFGN